LRRLRYLHKVIGGEGTVEAISFYAISVLLGLSGLLVVTEAVGFLPENVSRWLNRNRAAQTIAVLRELGLDTDRLKRRNIAMNITQHFQERDLPARVQEALKPLTIEKAVGVGGIDVVRAERYIDLMGGTTDPQTANMFARYLASFWRARLQADEADPPDFVVTPKAGSPILGFEFAKTLGLPLALHNSQKKYEVGPDEFRAHFDCGYPFPDRGLALIVDDSSTGGTKVLELLNDLRKFEYTAKDCLIVFEPQIKEVHLRISDRGIRLHSIIKV
jgi:orotate phosphoribosyltransferase